MRKGASKKTEAVAVKTGCALLDMCMPVLAEQTVEARKVARRRPDITVQMAIVAYAKSGMSISRAAKSLNVEYHIVKNRIDVAERVYGMDPKDFFGLTKILILMS